MARTKRYLTSNRGSTAKAGFYRPIKRSPVAPLKPKLNVQSAKTISSNEMQEIHEQIKEAEKLKQELKAKIQSQIQQSTKDVFTQLDEIIQTAHTRSQDHQTTHQADNEDEITSVKQTTPVSTTTQELEFGGRSSDSKINLLERELQASLKKAKQREKELDELKESFESERKRMSHTIKSLKTDLNEHIPITENKFFTISKELQSVVESMNKLLENENILEPSAVVTATPPPLPQAPVTTAQAVTTPPTTAPVVATATPTPPTTQPEVKTDTPADTQVKVESIPPQPADITVQSIPAQGVIVTKKKFAIPKPITILGSTLAIVLLIGGVLWFTFFNSKPQVDTALVQEYLPEGSNLPVQEPVPAESNGDEQTSEPATPSSNPSALQQHMGGDVQGAQDAKYAESQSDVTFTDTEWDTLKDAVLGYEVSYPKNSVNIIKTDASLTFIRKTGYIFKVQVFKTDLDVEDYWKLVSGTSLKYKITKTTFRELDALFLELEDFTDYPGDKYLVKHDDYIFDIWYATYSKTLSDDDLKRIDIMLNSFKFAE